MLDFQNIMYILPKFLGLFFPPPFSILSIVISIFSRLE